MLAIIDDPVASVVAMMECRFCWMLTVCEGKVVVGRMKRLLRKRRRGIKMIRPIKRMIRYVL